MRAVKKLLLVLLLGAVYTKGIAQNETFPSDRPGLSDAPDLIAPKTWQIASGFDISKYNHSGNYQLSENTLKYGISKRFEARFDFGLQYNPTTKKYIGPAPAAGIKALLLAQHKMRPKTALIIEYTAPSPGTLQSSGLATELCFSHTFKNGNSLYYNAGAVWQDISQKAILNSLIGYSYAISKNLNSFLEIYLYKTPSRQLNYVSDAGITYLVNKKMQLDLSAGMDLRHMNGNYNYSGGITYNF